jgi:hypothetical protein
MIFPVAASMVAVITPPFDEDCGSGMVLERSNDVLRDFEGRRLVLTMSASLRAQNLGRSSRQ